MVFAAFVCDWLDFYNVGQYFFYAFWDPRNKIYQEKRFFGSWLARFLTTSTYNFIIWIPIAIFLYILTLRFFSALGQRFNIAWYFLLLPFLLLWSVFEQVSYFIFVDFMLYGVACLFGADSFCPHKHFPDKRVYGLKLDVDFCWYLFNCFGTGCTNDSKMIKWIQHLFSPAMNWISLIVGIAAIIFAYSIHEPACGIDLRKKIVNWWEGKKREEDPKLNDGIVSDMLGQNEISTVRSRLLPKADGDVVSAKFFMSERLKNTNFKDRITTEGVITYRIFLESLSVGFAVVGC